MLKKGFHNLKAGRQIFCSTDKRQKDRIRKQVKKNLTEVLHFLI
jgi:hypothetical protein